VLHLFWCTAGPEVASPSEDVRGRVVRVVVEGQGSRVRVMVPGEEDCRRKPRPGGRFVGEADCQKEPYQKRR
jgi:hypothetical protein